MGCQAHSRRMAQNKPAVILPQRGYRDDAGIACDVAVLLPASDSLGWGSAIKRKMR